jgi:hypothetical protein
VTPWLGFDEQPSDQIGVLPGHAAGKKQSLAKAQQLYVIEFRHDDSWSYFFRAGK